MIEEFEKYLLYKERKSLSTIKTYSRCIEQFINWYYSSKNENIYQLDKETSKEYKDYLLLVEKKNTQTINVKLCALAMLSRFFYYKNPPKNYIVRKKYKRVN
ncbi:phage integrase N-terminal SAM-like domain-containing protein [Clostridium magnum]|uniref:Tyrosine recombinase XerC n=1 Tax=Clostridium magnum DSM 2767 TaxID=1121326 RepID=A0A161WVG2_9CLOT|nr:phage integrase N-terminal SAM-like domain-containing protein [Clostridium magnum]KZL90878.1 tyrosine recombinase XerC [Clostridium magnum DSM 2767]SHI12524.1 Phage integrase, N-terminal SAM-like domain [Clostridium magnum DSM 2767]